MRTLSIGRQARNIARMSATGVTIGFATDGNGAAESRAPQLSRRAPPQSWRGSRHRHPLE